jgi:foldase protein PrsA
MLAVSKLLFIVSAVLTFACGAKAVPPPAVSAPAVVQPATSPAVSADILAREPVANNADVKHILIGWKELGVRNERAANRSKTDAEQQVTAILAKLKSGSDFDSLMRELSEDEGSANSGKVFQVAPDAQLVIEFRQISLRLNVNEIGVCESDFGFHIVKRYR